MKRVWSILGLFLLVSAVALSGAGCKKRPKAGGGDDTTGALGSGEGAGPEADIGRGEEGARGQFQPVYFDYDSAVVRSGEEGKVQAVANFLRDTQGATVLVEGHCDERGSNEYNLSLGDRRAAAVRAALVASGIDGGRVNTRSMGEEMPAAPGHDEAAWAKNRRTEFVVFK